MLKGNNVTRTVQVNNYFWKTLVRNRTLVYVYVILEAGMTSAYGALSIGG